MILKMFINFVAVCFHFFVNINNNHIKLKSQTQFKSVDFIVVYQRNNTTINISITLY